MSVIHYNGLIIITNLTSIILLMLTQRKKFNYMGTSYSNPTSYKPLEKENSAAYQNMCRKMQELEAVNQKLLDDTTVQFQQFEADITRVQGILEAKEQINQYLQQENNQLKQQKSILIEALNEKEHLIVHYQDSLKAIEEERKGPQVVNQKLEQQSTSPEPTRTAMQTQTQFAPIKSQSTETEPQPAPTECRTVQTDESSGQQSAQQQSNERLILNLREEALGKEQKYEKIKMRSLSLEEEVCRLKQELFMACSELTMVRQEYSTAKLLEEIEAARKQ